MFDFLALTVDDRSRGELRALVDYQGLFPAIAAEIALEYERLTSASGTSTRSPQAPPANIGHYRMLQELGRGGQGYVWLAIDEELGRHVALKFVPDSFGSISPLRRERLRREAYAISRLDHPGICGVFEADLESATPYLAMRYVPGETLGARLELAREQRSSDPDATPRASSPPVLRPTRAEEFSEFLRFFEKLARALHAAHEAGLVHRDIKPSNVMVTPAGEPVILDFGLARDESSDEVTLTQSDAVVGTPIYMAPEQLGLAPGDPDRRTDVYALGVTLYESLTLERPFQGRGVDAVRESIRSGAAVDPKTYNPNIRSDLRVVVATAMEHDRERRYASALDLAEDLRRVREYEPIHARAPGAWTRLVRWSQRHPTIAASIAGSFLVLVYATVSEWRRTNSVRAALHEANEANAKLVSASLRDKAASLGRTMPLRALLAARDAYKNDHSAQSGRAVLDALQRPTEEWRVETTAFMSPDSFDTAPTSPLLAAGTDSGQLLVWDSETHRTKLDLQVSSVKIACVRFAPDETRVAYSTASGEAGIVALDAQAVQVRFAGHSKAVLWAEFDASGERVATASLDGTVRIWSAVDGRELRSIDQGGDPVGIARWNKAGDRLATTAGNVAHVAFKATGSDSVRVWDAESGALISELLGHTDSVRSVQWSKDGRRVLTASQDNTARMWDGETGRESWRATSPGESGTCARFSPSEARVAFAYDPGIQMLDAESGTLLSEIRDSGERRVSDIDFSPDERLFTAASQDGVVRVFRTATGERLAEYRGLNGLPSYVRFCSGGRRIVCRDSRIVQTWRCDRRLLPAQLVADGKSVLRADLDATGAIAITGSEDGCLRLWAVEDAYAEPALLSRGARIVSSSFDHKAERMAVLREDGTCEIRSGSAWLAPATMRSLHTELTCGGFSPSGRIVWAGAKDGRVWVFDPRADTDAVPVGPPRGAVVSACISPDDKTMFTVHADDTVHVWDLPTSTALTTRTELATLPHEGNSSRGPTTDSPACFNREGTLAAVAFGPASRLFLYGVPDWKPLPGWNTANRGTVQFGPHSDVIVEVSKWNATVTVTSIATGTELACPHFGPWVFVDSDVSPDGRLLAMCFSDPTAIVFDIEQRMGTLELSQHKRSIASIRFSRDGNRIITASKDGTAIVWPVNVEQEAWLRFPFERDGLLRKSLGASIEEELTHGH